LRLTAAFLRGEDFFNHAFQMSYTGIIKRTCPSCTNSHREVYYKRITKRKTFKPYYYMFNNWRLCDNELNVDFEMYGTYKDALQGTKL
jgi:hypothetical protein